MLRRRARVAPLATAAVGVLLLIWLLWSSDLSQVWVGLRRVGWAILGIIAIAGLRFGVRAAAWIRCLEPPHRLRFADAFNAVICGDALGNATPLGPLVSEPAKVAFVRERVPLGPAFTALAIENVFYTLSVAAVIAAGITALLLRGGLDDRIQMAAELGIAMVLALYVMVTWALVRQPALLSRTLDRASRVLRSASLQRRIGGVRQLEEDIYSFAARRRGVVGGIIAAELVFHALGVLEVFLTLWLLRGAPPSLATAFILETANRLITVVFKFVPMQQAGFNEAGTVLAGQVLGVGTDTAAALAIVRRVRMLFWQLAGTVLLLRHGVTARRILQDEELRAKTRGASA